MLDCRILLLQVNNAGSVIKGNFLETNEDVLDKMWNIHVKSVFNLTKLAAPHLIKTKGA